MELNKLSSRKNFHKTIISKKKNLNYHKNHLIDEKNYFIQKDNETLISKIKNIAFRHNKLLEPNLGILIYRKEKEKNLKNIRKLYQKSLEESNSYFKNKLNHSKSFINNKKIFQDYKITRKVYKNLRKIHPSNSLDYSLKHSTLKYKSLDELMNKSYKITLNQKSFNLPLIKIFPL
jgi:hypothetical protein